jgi:putative tricarboxylic transport membrane protein
MLVAACVGYVMTAFGYPVIVFIIAFFLGAGFESSLSQSLVILDGDPRALISHPVALALLILAVVTMIWLARGRSLDSTDPKG